MKEKIRAWWRRNDTAVFHVLRWAAGIGMWLVTSMFLSVCTATIKNWGTLLETEIPSINAIVVVLIGTDVCLFFAFLASLRARDWCDGRRCSQQEAERSSGEEAERQVPVMPQPKPSQYSTAEQYRAERYAKEAQDGISKLQKEVRDGITELQDAIREIHIWNSVTDVKLKQLEQCVDRIEQSIRETGFLQIENLTLKNQKAMLEDTNRDLRRQITALQESKYQKLQRKYDTLLDKTRSQPVSADTSEGGPHGT